MVKHRSLGNALLSPEKMAFITGQESSHADNPIDMQPPIQSNPVVVPVVELAAPTSIAQEVRPLKNKSAVNQPQPTVGDSKRTNSPAPANDDYLVAITTRLQARTADALRRAYLGQKLNRCEPATQQEIIELAVQQWLRKNGFFD